MPAYELPEQMNNEIRNAFTHLSRIHFAETIKEIDNERSKGLGHIHRAARDCLKYTVFHLHKRLQTQHKWARVLHKAVSPDLCARSSEIKTKVRAVIARETKGQATEAEWLAIIDESKRLSDDYHTTYGIEFAARPLTAFMYMALANWLPILIGVIVGICMTTGKDLANYYIAHGRWPSL